jgi:hypothetical protein
MPQISVSCRFILPFVHPMFTLCRSCLLQCGNCFLTLCQFENRFNPTMLPCAAKYYADIWPCYKDHYKQYDFMLRFFDDNALLHCFELIQIDFSFLFPDFVNSRCLFAAQTPKSFSPRMSCCSHRYVFLCLLV